MTKKPDKSASKLHFLKSQRNITPETQVVSRSTERGQKNASKLLEKVGNRLSPDGTSYMASFACHIYKNYSNDDPLIITQLTPFSKIPQQIVDHALRELTLRLLEIYGHSAPAKRGTDNSPNMINKGLLK